jgi:hypothetical protein
VAFFPYPLAQPAQVADQRFVLSGVPDMARDMNNIR